MLSRFRGEKAFSDVREQMVALGPLSRPARAYAVIFGQPAYWLLRCAAGTWSRPVDRSEPWRLVRHHPDLTAPLPLRPDCAS